MNKFQICSAALASTRSSSLTSFEGKSAEAQAASAGYEDILENCLTIYPWTFAQRQAEMDEVEAETPRPYNHTYQLPTLPPVLSIRTVLADGQRINYTRMEDKILTREAGIMTVDYTFRPNEEDLPPQFRGYLIARLAEFFALAVKSDIKLSMKFADKAELLLQRAQTLEAQQITSKRLGVSKFVAAHRGRGRF